jgi:FAD/FMN-containing dehydrogenase
MQSDKYGDIEDMCLSLKIVTPGVGTITTPFVPRNGSGPALKHLFIGTEGTLASRLSKPLAYGLA